MITAPLTQCERPTGESIRAPEGGLQHRARSHDQKRSQVRIAVRGDAPEPRLAAGRVLLRSEAEPGRELPAVSELVSLRHARNDSRGADRSDTTQGLDASRALILSCVLFELAFVFADAFIEHAHMGEQVAERSPRQHRQLPERRSLPNQFEQGGIGSVVFDELAQDDHVSVASVQGLQWTEIDCAADLERARTLTARWRRRRVRLAAASPVPQLGE